MIGIRAGEKIHETLISEDESRKVKVFQDCYVILPQFYESPVVHQKYDKCPGVPEGFLFRSDKNEKWVTGKQLETMINKIRLQ